MKCSLGISNFLEIPSLSHSIVFLYFFALVTEEGFLISPCYSLEFCIQIDISFLFSFAFNFFFQVFVRPPQTTILPFCISFPWGWSWSLPPVLCHKPPSMVLQALLSINKGQKWCGPNRSRNIKKRWQEYIEQLYKKDLHDPDNHDGVINSPRARHPGMWS